MKAKKKEGNQLKYRLAYRRISQPAQKILWRMYSLLSAANQKIVNKLMAGKTINKMAAGENQCGGVAGNEKRSNRRQPKRNIEIWRLRRISAMAKMNLAISLAAAFQLAMKRKRKSARRESCKLMAANHQLTAKKAAAGLQPGVAYHLALALRQRVA
jgi:hypothetical protein